MNRDVITIGASTGGLEVLLDLVSGLPADLPASLFVVVHVAPNQASVLPELLTRRGPLPAKHPLHDEPVKPGTIYVAPPDNHLILRDGVMAVLRGPKENGHRPAANALFRSASAAFGPRVIGVVLSGHLDCGTAGMMSIKARGGVSVVQAPETARAPDMPSSVIRNVAVDHVVAPGALAALLDRLVRAAPDPVLQPGMIIDQLEGTRLGTPSPVVCPICDGVLTEAQAGHYEHFRCHVGHSFSLASLVEQQGEQMERALWAAVRALEESAALSRKIATSESGDLRMRFVEKAETQAREAELIRQILLRGEALSDADAAETMVPAPRARGARS